MGPDGLLWLTACFCAACVVVAIFLPGDRNRVRASVIIFGLSILGLLLAALIPNSVDTEGMDKNVYFHWTKIISLFLLSAAIVTISGAVVFDILLPAVKARPATILCELILAFVYIAAALLLLWHAKVNVTGVVATSAVVTAAIGLSLQGTLSNVMGGVAIQLDRTIAVGDWIHVGDSTGVVKEIRWRQTSIETRNGDTVLVPNGMLVSGNVAVLGKRSGSPRQHRQYVHFNVDYRFPPTQVIAAINEALTTETIANVSSTPAPHCLLLDFKDSYGGYAVRYWLTDLWQDESTDSLIRCRVVFALKRRGISIAIPAYRTFQTEEDQERRRRIMNEDLDRRLAALSRVDIFSTLNDEERKCLAARLRVCPFAGGESMTRQGEDSPCLFIITLGDAEVRVAVDGHWQQKAVAHLKAGEFFGEMGLLTGDVRSASVIAMSDVSCLRLDKEDFVDVLQRRPEIAESISQILAQRRMELEAARDHLTGEAQRERLKKTQGDLLQRIRKFFTIER